MINTLSSIDFCTHEEVKHVHQTFSENIYKFIRENHQKYSGCAILDIVSDYLGQYKDEPYSLFHTKFLKWNIPIHQIHELTCVMLMESGFDLKLDNVYNLADDFIARFHQHNFDMMYPLLNRRVTFHRCLYTSLEMVYGGMGHSIEDVKNLHISELEELIEDKCDCIDPFEDVNSLKAAKEFLKQIND